jgi:hypothetical protein
MRVVAARPSLAARSALVQAHQSADGRLAVAVASAAPIAAAARAGIVIDLIGAPGASPTVTLDRLSLE